MTRAVTAAACAAAKLASTGFHDLRRTYGARLALRGVPMAVIAEALGHADERITRRHYAHLSKSYVAETVRGAVAGLGIVEASNVVRLAQSLCYTWAQRDPASPLLNVVH